MILWDIKEKTILKQVKLYEPIEDFELCPKGLVVGNGAFLSFIDVEKFEETKSIPCHRRTIMKIHYDESKQRLITCGADSHIKFHDLESG